MRNSMNFPDQITNEFYFFPENSTDTSIADLDPLSVMSINDIHSELDNYIAFADQAGKKSSPEKITKANDEMYALLQSTPSVYHSLTSYFSADKERSYLASSLNLLLRLCLEKKDREF